MIWASLDASLDLALERQLGNRLQRVVGVEVTGIHGIDLPLGMVGTGQQQGHQLLGHAAPHVRQRVSRPEHPLPLAPARPALQRQPEEEQRHGQGNEAGSHTGGC